MDIVAFIKSIILDSFGGIPSKLFPFIVFQLICSLLISIIFGKVFKVEAKELFQLVLSGVAILGLSIIASISIPIALVFSVLIVLWVMHFKHVSLVDRVVFVMIQFLFGAGYVLLGIISMVIIAIYFLLNKGKMRHE